MLFSNTAYGYLDSAAQEDSVGRLTIKNENGPKNLKRSPYHGSMVARPKGIHKEKGSLSYCHAVLHDGSEESQHRHFICGQ